MKVLLVGGQPADDQQVRDLLESAEATETDVVTVVAVEDAAPQIEVGHFDVVLVDVGGDRARLDLIDDVLALRSGTPVVALADATPLVAEATEHGAHDGMVRADLDAPFLLRTLRYAVAPDRWDAALDRLSSTPAGSTRTRYHDAALAQTAPDVFADLTERYADVVLQTLESEAYRDAVRPTERMRALGSYLGVLRAHPRDVIDLHLATVRRLAEERTAPSSALLSVGRIVLVEVMGQLAAYYRNYAWGGPRAASGSEGGGGR